MTHRLTVRLRNGLLLGGGEARGLHDVTLRDANDVPYIPGSALKGAIREQLGRILPAGVDAADFLGGRGRDPLGGVDTDGGAPPRPERPGGGSTRVYFSDATLDDEPARRFAGGIGYAVRPQVSIDRHQRRAAHQRFFQREVVAPFAGELVFRAQVDASRLDAEERGWLRGAVEAVFAIGAGRSTGLGWVEMRLEKESAPGGGDGVGSPSTPASLRSPIEAGESLELLLEAVDPVCIGIERFTTNFIPSRSHVPSSTLRGAVATAALAHEGVVGDQSEEPRFRSAFIDPVTCLRFGDALPTSSFDSQSAPQTAPLTLRTGKYGGQKQGVMDVLVRDYLLRCLGDAGRFVAVSEERRAGGREDRWVPAGPWRRAELPRRRVMTRLALDPVLARGEDGRLFSVEVLEKASRFVARVDRVGEEGRRYLIAAAAAGLRIGHGRGQGYGRVRIVGSRAVRDVPLEERVRRLDDYVRRGLAAARAAVPRLAEPESHRVFVAALLLTDLVITAAEVRGGAEAAFLGSLALGGAEVVHGQVGIGQRGGFDGLQGFPRDLRPTVRAGSVLLLTLPRLDETALAELAARERDGIGGERERGFGSVRFSDPIHYSEDRR